MNNYTEEEQKRIYHYNDCICELMGYRFWHTPTLKFHTSWEWLMPVVEKIESIEDDYHGNFSINISSNACHIIATNLDSRPESFYPAYLDDSCHDTKLLATWTCVARFAEWYKHKDEEKQTA